MNASKTLLLAAAALLFALDASAQPQRYRYERTETDTTITFFNHREQYSFRGNDAVREVKRARRNDRWEWTDGHFMGVTINYNGLTGTGGGQPGAWAKLDTKAIGVDLNLIDFPIYSFRNFGIISGLQIESNNYRFRNNVSIKKDDNGTVVPDWSYDEQGIDLDKSKLTTTYLNIPLLFEYQFNRRARNRNWQTGWVSVGGIVGLRLQSYTKVKLPDGTKIKNFDDFNLKNLHYGLIAGIGWGGLGLWGKYYFGESMFRKGEGPQMQQFSIGVGITF